VTGEILGKESLKKFLTVQNIILFHYALCSIGLFKFTWTVSRISYQHLNFDVIISHMCDWIAVFNHAKMPQLIFFILSLCAMFIFYGLALLTLHSSSKKKKLWLNTVKPSYWVGYFFYIFLINVGVYIYLTALSALLWTLSFMTLPAILCLLDIKNFFLSMQNNKLKMGPRGCWIVTGIASLIFTLVFFPIIFKPIQIANEFMSIPEQTIHPNGHLVDNAQYVNKHHLGGLHLYDPRNAEEKLDLVGVNVPKTPLLEIFLSQKIPIIFL